MTQFHYTKLVKLLRTAICLLCALSVAAEAESNIDKYRNKNKPLFRRYKEKVNIQKGVSPSVQAEKRSLPPSAFKKNGLFKSGIGDELPGDKLQPLPETPFIPDEIEPAKPMINSANFSDGRNNASRYELPEDKEADANKETILDFDQLSEEIVNQEFGNGNSILSDGILPSEEELAAGMDDKNSDDEFSDEALSENPFDSLLRDQDGVTPFRPALSPNLAKPEGDDERGTNPQDPGSANGDQVSEDDLRNLPRSDEDRNFERAVPDSRMVVGELPENSDEDDDSQDVYTQSQTIITALTQPHLEKVKQSQEKRRSTSTTEDLLAKYRITPSEVGYGPKDRGATADRAGTALARGDRTGSGRTNPLSSGNDDDALSRPSLLSNPAVSLPGRDPSSSTAFRPTSDVESPSLGSLSLTSPDASNGSLFSNARSPNGASLGGSAFRPPMGSDDRRFGGALSNRGLQRAAGMNIGRTDPLAGAGGRGGGLGGPSASPRDSGTGQGGFDLMRETRERNRVRSSLGSNNLGPFGR